MRNRYVGVGIFVVVGSLLFATAVFLIGNQHNVFSKHIELFTEVKNLNGLTKGAKIRVAGFDAGEVADIGMGRRRQYCRQSCRQRAYEQRAMVRGTSVAPDAVVLTADEASELSDRVYQVRCAAEDVATAIEEGAESTELRYLCDALIRAAKAADGWR